MMNRRRSLLALASALVAPSVALAEGRLTGPLALLSGASATAPLTERALDNLVALARLAGYLRHFHPSDQAAAADWQALTIEGARRAEPCADAETLARTLQEFFAPVAPTLQVFVTGATPQQAPLVTGPEVTAWIHVGDGQDAAMIWKEKQSVYQSVRVRVAPDQIGSADFPLDPAAPYEMALPGGVTCRVPLALFADADGTLPRVPAMAAFEADASSADGARATRFAAVAMAWNAMQHFYPYFHVVRVDWPAELTKALRSAATEADIGAFKCTLQRMVETLADGHINVYHRDEPAEVAPAFHWASAEGQIVITAVETDARTLRPGDLIVETDGMPAMRFLAEREALRSGTPQWKRYVETRNLLCGAAGSTVDLVIERGGERFAAAFKRTRELPQKERTGPIFRELEPGLCYLDLDRCEEADFQAALPALAAAKGVIFDMRGYPTTAAQTILAHVGKETLRSAHWKVPVTFRPDRTGVEFMGSDESRWTLPPRTPRIAGRVAFLTYGGSISYAESIMGIVEAYGLGEIVGSTTAGANGDLNVVRLPGGYSLTFTGLRVVRHDGEEHHCRGIAPTVPVQPTIAGLAAGRDEVRERANAVVKG